MIYTDNKGIAASLNINYCNEKEIYSCLEDIQLALCSRSFASRLFELKPSNLKTIQLLSAGHDHVDIEGFKSIGVDVFSALNVYSIAISEYIIYSMLCYAKKNNENIKNRLIRIFRNYKYITEISNKKIIILGVGGIGSELAKRLNNFDMVIIGFAKNTKHKAYFSHIINNRDALIELLPKCDYLVSTLPHDISTDGFINHELLSKLGNNTTFINVGRTKTINENDLYCHLKNNLGFTAFLDMFEMLPNPITNKFRRLKNVIVYPGVTAISSETNQRLTTLCRKVVSEFNTAIIKNNCSSLCKNKKSLSEKNETK
jgi:phosphoglycerate dehydrogenase-like enzyme